MAPYLDDSTPFNSATRWANETYWNAMDDDDNDEHILPPPGLPPSEPPMPSEPVWDIARNMEEINASRALRGAPPVFLTRLHEDVDDYPVEQQEQEIEKEEEPPLSGPESLIRILEREEWDEFGFIVFRTFYRDEALWEAFLDEYEPILRDGVRTTSDSDIDTESLSQKLRMNIVSDECMENKIPAHVALAYRMFEDVEPGLRTKMCLIVDEECMRSVVEGKSGSVPFVKAVDVTLGGDSESAFPGVVKVAVSSLLGEFYPALVDCDTVWEIVPNADDIWGRAREPEDGVSGWEEIQGVLNGTSVSR